MDFAKKAFSVVLFVALTANVFAEDITDISERQKELSDRLDSIENAQAGVSIGGELKAGVSSSKISSGSEIAVGVPLLADGEPTKEISPYTHGNLEIIARPNSFSRAKVGFTVHKDWQQSYAEGPNPIAVNWLGYDGEYKDKVKFFIGDYYISNTPLTIYNPELELLGEAEIFTEKREEIQEERLINGNKRFMPGFMIDYNSGEVGVFDNLQLKVNAARLRSVKLLSETWFNFDEADRYTYGIRGSAGAWDGIDLGVNFVSTFNRQKSSRAVEAEAFKLSADNTFTDVDKDPYGKQLEYNNVLSVDGDFDFASVFGLNNFVISVDGEFAMSNYNMDVDYAYNDTIDIVVEYDTTLSDEDSDVEILTPSDTDYVRASEPTWHLVPDVNVLKGTALNVALNLGYKSKVFSGVLAGRFIKNDEEFESELAQTPTFLTGTGILNTDINSPVSLSSTMESMYNSVYHVEALTIRNTMKSANAINTPSGYMTSYTTNNYIRSHYTRNAYSNQIYTNDEKTRANQAKAETFQAGFVQEKVNFVMPVGLATPNREGFDVAINLAGLDNTIKLDVNYKQLNELVGGELPAYIYSQDLPLNYSEISAGLSLYLNSMLDIEKFPMALTFGYSNSSKETAEAVIATGSKWDYKVDRISAGLKVGYEDKVAFLFGFQTLDGTADFSGYYNNEQLWAAGLEYKIASGSYLNLQYGQLKSVVNPGLIAGNAIPEYEYTRNLTSAEISVMF